MRVPVRWTCLRRPGPSWPSRIRQPSSATWPSQRSWASCWQPWTRPASRRWRSKGATWRSESIPTRRCAVCPTWICFSDRAICLPQKLCCSHWDTKANTSRPTKGRGLSSTPAPTNGPVRIQRRPRRDPYLSTAGDRHVDPHGSLEESWFGLRVDVTPGIWQRSRPALLVGQPARAMADEDLLLHLSVHLVFHLLMSKPSLVQLYDIALVSQTLPLDWTALLGRAADRGASAFLYAALHLAEQVYGAHIQGNTLARLRDTCSPAQSRRIERMGLDEVVQQTQRPPLVTIRQRLARGISDRREAARWAPDVAGKWAVWRTAIDIGRTDTGKLLGDRLRNVMPTGRGRAASL
ncbi:MAG: nucleotidyltransferase family protein [Caldilineales bacterium]